MPKGKKLPAGAKVLHLVFERPEDIELLEFIEKTADTMRYPPETYTILVLHDALRMAMGKLPMTEAGNVGTPEAEV